MTAKQVENAPTGRHGLGNGLYLLVRENGSRFWVFRWTRDGRMREMGLGRAPGRNKDHAAIPLKDATEAAGQLLKLVRSGVDPLAQRQQAEAAAKSTAQADAAAAKTFRDATAEYVQAFGASWGNPKHAKQWETTLRTYAFPAFGDMATADIETAHVLAALQPIWTTKTETAARVRGRIEAVLNYATTAGWRTGDNPARWRGHLSNLLASKAKVAPVEHHAALPWVGVGGFVASLRNQAGIGAQALQFAILTAARTGEVIGATWSEIDLAGTVWTIPASRTKAGREHRVPLSAPALAILADMAKLARTDAANGFIFPSTQTARPLSNMAMTAVLRRMDRSDLTVHGFRSTFRDWVVEHAGFPAELAEAALAHVTGDRTVQAYARGDLFDKRRALMAEWGTFCGTPYVKPEPGKVVSLRARDSADSADRTPSSRVVRR
jgi:integrase